MAERIVVIGGGPAAVAAAVEAKKTVPMGHVTLATDEVCEPYEKPPLSKAVLLGKATPEGAPIAGPGGVAGRGVAIKTNTRCVTIDRTARQVTTTNGVLPYDTLVIATGSIMRQMPSLPMGMPRVHYLRTEAHARAIKADLSTCRNLVVIGAGLIGLEVAASAAELGINVRVVELAPQIMARACDHETAAIVQAEHQRRGVAFALSTAVTAVTTRDDGIALQSSGGETYVADLVVVGVGVMPADELASAAGLDVQDGIIVDAQCRTSDPHIFAAGDATRFATARGAVRLENWRHAQEHGAIAGRNAAGARETYRALPSYWSEQYDLYIQGIGWPDRDATRVRRHLPAKGMLLLETKSGVISYALGINAQRDLGAVRRLIEREVPVNLELLADPSQSLAAMLKMQPTS